MSNTATASTPVLVEDTASNEDTTPIENLQEVEDIQEGLRGDLRRQVMMKEQGKANKKVSASPYNFDQEGSREDLAHMVIMHEYPLAMVDHVGFRKFVSGLQPNFKLVSRNTLKRDILKIYDYEKQKSMAKIDNNGSRVAITTDMWTSSNKKRGFMVVTGHYINDSWILESQIMRFIYVPSPHTKEVLSTVLLECLLEWNVDRKLSTVTVDNCTTNDAMMRILLEKLEVSSLALGGSLLHMRCAAHILNLVVQDGLAVIGDGIERIRDSVLFWTASPKRRQKFDESSRHLRISNTKELVLDCKTRWNSTYLMLSSALIYKDVFSRLRHFDALYTCMPNERDWEVAKDICEKLEVFYSVTKLFSGTTYPTANEYFPMLCELKMELNEWIVSPNELIKLMASKMLEKFNGYWSVVNGIMCIAAILDPRYKMKIMEYYYQQVYGRSKGSEEVEKIKKIFFDLLAEYGSENSDEEASCSLPPSSMEIVSHDFVQNRLRKFDSFVSNTTNNRNKKSESVVEEFDTYIKEGVLKRSEIFDILGWWNHNGLKYPTLQRLARDILAIPVTTVASESAFSTSGRLLSPHRSRLHPRTLEALMCAQSWLWSELKGSSPMPEDATIQNILEDYDDHEEEESGAMELAD
uniref:HAT C-terminal dimerisation domain-containing protein n=1 Tax=Fagus sylvatica TaxID=28930 RepID=A0A2N9FWV6_FAGSY